MVISILSFILSLINPSNFGGFPVDASIPGLAYSVTARYGFPNLDNVSSFSLLKQGGVVLSFAYVPESITDVLNYGSHVKFKNLTAAGFYSKGAGFFYRLISRREIKLPDKETEYSIDEFSLAVSDMLYYNLYGGLCLNYYYVRFGEAAIVNGSPEVNLDTGNGFSIDLGLIFKYQGISFGFSSKNVVSGIYYSKFEKDVLRPSLSLGVNLVPLKILSLSLDGFIEKNGKPFYFTGFNARLLKWLGIFGGYTFNDKSYGGGVELNYRSSDFVISYRKKAVFLTWRFMFE